MMKRLMLVGAVVGLIGCGTMSTTDAGTGGGSGGGATGGGSAVGGGSATGGGSSTGGGTGGGNDAGVTLDLTSSTKILNYLSAKTMVMTGTDIPSHPNGFNENLNFGASTQCYNKVSIATLANNFAVTSDLGTFTAIPDAGIAGTCNRAVKSGTVSFTSSAVLIENVKNNAECFDITITFTGFKQEGRGKISADGKTVTLELFFAATGHRCVDGAVGAATVKLSGANFTGNAQQVYRLP